MLEHNLHTSLRNIKQREAVQIHEGVFAVCDVLDGSSDPESRDRQVTYRMIRVPSGLGRFAVNAVSSANLTGAQHDVTQTVIQNSSPNGGSTVGERTEEEAQCAYYPEASVSEGTTTGDPSFLPTSGQFYVMMTPPDILHSSPQRTLAPRIHTYTPKLDSKRTNRDERRKAQHNEVERRRRDKINNWIVTLSKIIPDCSMESTKPSASKGGILSKACDYIAELQEHNQHLQERLRSFERLQMDHDLLRQQLQELKSENILLQSQLELCGVEPFPEAPAH